MADNADPYESSRSAAHIIKPPRLCTSRKQVEDRMEVRPTKVCWHSRFSASNCKQKTVTIVLGDRTCLKVSLSSYDTHWLLSHTIYFTAAFLSQTGVTFLSEMMSCISVPRDYVGKDGNSRFTHLGKTEFQDSRYKAQPWRVLWGCSTVMMSNNRMSIPENEHPGVEQDELASWKDRP